MLNKNDKHEVIRIQTLESERESVRVLESSGQAEGKV